MTTHPDEGALGDLLERVDPDKPRIVVRFIDETRIVAEGESGYTVGPVSSVLVTSFHDGKPVQTRFDDLTIAQARRIISRFPIEVLYRSDNITR